MFERAGVLGQMQGGGAWCPDGICAGNSIQMPVSYSCESCHLALTIPTALFWAVMGVTWTGSHLQWVPTSGRAAAGGRWGVPLPRPGVPERSRVESTAWWGTHCGGGASRPGDSRRAEALPSAQLQAELLLALTQTGLGQWRACR